MQILIFLNHIHLLALSNKISFSASESAGTALPILTNIANVTITNQKATVSKPFGNRNYIKKIVELKINIWNFI